MHEGVARAEYGVEQALETIIKQRIWLLRLARDLAQIALEEKTRWVISQLVGLCRGLQSDELLLMVFVNEKFCCLKELCHGKLKQCLAFVLNPGGWKCQTDLLMV